MDTNVIPADIHAITASDPQYRDRMLAYVMDKLDVLAQYPIYVDNAIAQIAEMKINDTQYGGQGDAARASAIGNSVAAREETNRALIEFLKQIYNDVKPVNPQIYKPIPQDNQKASVYQSVAAFIDRIDPDVDSQGILLSKARDMLHEFN